MNEYIVKASVIKTKEKKVINITVLQYAENVLEAERIVKEKLIRKEGTGCVFIKNVTKKTGALICN